MDSIEPSSGRVQYRPLAILQVGGTAKGTAGKLANINSVVDRFC